MLRLLVLLLYRCGGSVAVWLCGLIQVAALPTDRHPPPPLSLSLSVGTGKDFFFDTPLGLGSVDVITSYLSP